MHHLHCASLLNTIDTEDVLNEIQQQLPTMDINMQELSMFSSRGLSQIKEFKKEAIEYLQEVRKNSVELRQEFLIELPSLQMKETQTKLYNIEKDLDWDW